MKTIRVISCGKTKRPGTSPAKDLYVGTFFKQCRMWAEESPDGWIIFSAKHGVLLPDELVECYDQHDPVPDWKEKVLAKLDKNAHYLSVAGNQYMSKLKEYHPTWIENVFPMGGDFRMGKKRGWLRVHTESRRGLFS